MSEPRGRWRSRLGFVLAASGSAIGLGNVVFFGSNAYAYGFGAFYLPYLIALFLVGVPVLITELGLGSLTQQGFPAAMRRVGGKWGELAGWWALLNSSFITMYYVTIIAWVSGMFLGAVGPLWGPETATPGYAAESLPNPMGFFFGLIASPWVLALVVVVWGLNVFIVRRGVATIEPVVKVFVPLMWVFMIVLIIRGLTLPDGKEGIFLLFTPDFQIAKDPAVWQGAVSQIFFSLTLGFGVMTAYASYLPKNADQVNNGIVTASLNCGFEYIAGLAIFSLLFAFAIVPSAGTLSMIFFVVPAGIGALPAAVKVFGLLFFLLLLMAGLSSSVSLVEGVNVALIDKFGWRRRKTLAACAGIGLVGSLLFALPQVIDPELASTGDARVHPAQPHRQLGVQPRPADRRAGGVPDGRLAAAGQPPARGAEREHPVPHPGRLRLADQAGDPPGPGLRARRLDLQPGDQHGPLRLEPGGDPGASAAGAGARRVAGLDLRRRGVADPSPGQGRERAGGRCGRNDGGRSRGGRGCLGCSGCSPSPRPWSPDRPPRPSPRTGSRSR